MVSLVIILFAALALPLVLVGLHFGLWRVARQPPPLLRREHAVSRPGRVLAGVLGVAACYLVCALAAFAALRTAPTEATLTLDVLPGGPAAEAGARSGDIARGIDGRKVGRFEEFVDGVRKGGPTVALDLERDGQPIRVVVTKSPDGKVGVASRFTMAPAGRAAARALALPAVYIAQMASAFGEMITGSSQKTLQGPVGIARAAGRRDAGTALQLLALLLAFHLPKVALVYILALALDGYARRRYLRARAA
jgi:membrane-associated protease RseP (regulator of RpoE activity)